ncbi:hypothetical protein KZI27_00975 (plasmid) [Curtobacterium sp. TC1]|uniref:hypothetical protein n=1 Tax=Curtobacterium sp. TC1 TaxID=2862880 RepID=UPI001C9B1816|nr:hypothetical protein [Curtobacterium sp. TC1]QZQ53748.1 hypothetical protein KZI27_00975 [Curtobacterium sp. TC1]
MGNTVHDPRVDGIPATATAAGTVWHGIPVSFLPLVELADELLPLGTPDYLLEWRRDAADTTHEWTLLTDWDRSAPVATIGPQPTVAGLLDATETAIRVVWPSARIVWVVASTLWEAHDQFPAGDTHGCFYIWVVDTDPDENRRRTKQVTAANTREPGVFQILGALRDRHQQAATSAVDDQDVAVASHADGEQTVVDADSVGQHRNAAACTPDESRDCRWRMHPRDGVIRVGGLHPDGVAALLVPELLTNVVREDRAQEHRMVKAVHGGLVQSPQRPYGGAVGELLPRDVPAADMCPESCEDQRLVPVPRNERCDRGRTAKHLAAVTRRAVAVLGNTDVQVEADTVRVAPVTDVDDVAVLVAQSRGDRREVVVATNDVPLLWGVLRATGMHERRCPGIGAVAVMQHHRAVVRGAQPPRVRLHPVYEVVLPHRRRRDRRPTLRGTRLPNTRHPLTVRNARTRRKDR